VLSAIAGREKGKMENKSIPLGFLGLGILIGVGLYFLSYWWTGSITLSAIIGISVGGGIMLAKQFKKQFKEKEEQR
jgi:hypothetical protein